MSFSHRPKSGFTLIELLVVIAIIGLLASIVFASLNSARAKARDAKRRSDLNQLRTALELYYSNHGNYPITTTWYGVTSMHDSTHVQLSGPLGWIPDLAPEGIPVLPRDPRDLGTDSGYLYYSNSSDYKLVAFQTTESICPIPPSDGMYDPARNPGTAWGPKVPCTFAMYTPGAAGW
ncbi:MAG: hypothetical protein A3B37_02285 [Candidatus Sungbacteria bacterium RIFCSPLOWO2_01_FULL_59_16]|uniref:Type II secretion system protein GspG C-terminal domain-containing protein n=1 Tax=Candidatus Sungbacteria bacterium RIFCSPLOWO2_01_FULL_59_16 TaxID=1802280 RepID=A0A1G2LEY3_9BACT|nr:MAG: hypothetical protein A3B37_02285 [Candidatus Sungbacteria bacterium RIFCSPLOWO2_01_FULL_59_16]